MSDEKSDQKQAAPSRLHGLSSSSRNRGGGPSGRGGRFMPNAVNRRSREERDSSAPALKSSEASPDDVDKGKNRNKFERRKQRQLGTRAEAAGPLAAPSIAAAARPKPGGGATGGGERSSTRMASVRIKSDPDGIANAMTSNQRIDMASGGAEGIYFPVRMPRDRPKAESKVPENANGKIPGQIIDDDSSILSLESNQLYLLQLPELSLAAGRAPDGSNLRTSQQTAMKAASKAATKPNLAMSRSGSSSPQENSGPKIKADPDGDQDMPDVNIAEDDDTMASSALNTSSESELGPSGQLGSLRTHASGKVTLLVGEKIYEVMSGSQSASAEELLLLDQQSKVAALIGNIGQRLLIVPDLDSLHI